MPLDKEQLDRWHGRIALAKRYQEKHGNSDLSGVGPRWDAFVKASAGDFNSVTDLGSEAIDVNLVHATQKTALPPLWLQEPYIAFKPLRERVRFQNADVDNIRRAEFAEVEINHWFRELNIREKVTKPCVIDAEATNHGYAYIGYLRSKDKKQLEIDGERIEPNPLMQLRQPFVIRLSPKQLLFPPGFNDLEDHPWICIRWLKRLGDVEARYGPEKTENIPTVHVLADEERRNTNDENLREFLMSDDAKMVEIQQVFNKRSKEIYTLADKHDQVLLQEDWTIETEGFPVVDLSFVDISDEYYGTPPTQYYFPQQKEKNAARTALRRRFNRQKALVIVDSSISEEFKEAYKNAKDGELITIDTGGEGLQNKVIIDNGLPTNIESIAYDQQISSDLIQIQGLSAEQRGAGDPNVRTATSSANIEAHARVRSSDRADRVRSFYLKTARKLYMVLNQFPDLKRDRLVIGPGAGQIKRFRYTLREIRGEFALQLELSTMLPETPGARLTQALANYNLLRADPLANPEQLILDVMQAQNKPNPQDYLLFLRQPAEELQMMLQGLPVEPHERDNHEVHLREHELQMQQIDDRLARLDPNTPEGVKLRSVLFLVMAHVNSTQRIVQQIVNTGAGRQPGTALSTNLFRNQAREAAGSETSAELTGQNLASVGAG